MPISLVNTEPVRSSLFSTTSGDESEHFDLLSNSRALIQYANGTYLAFISIRFDNKLVRIDLLYCPINKLVFCAVFGPSPTTRSGGHHLLDVSSEYYGSIIREAQMQPNYKLTF